LVRLENCRGRNRDTKIYGLRTVPSALSVHKNDSVHQPQVVARQPDDTFHRRSLPAVLSVHEGDHVGAFGRRPGETLDENIAARPGGCPPWNLSR
jgi:hypothetical protein